MKICQKTTPRVNHLQIIKIQVLPFRQIDKQIIESLATYEKILLEKIVAINSIIIPLFSRAAFKFMSSQSLMIEDKSHQDFQKRTDHPVNTIEHSQWILIWMRQKYQEVLLYSTEIKQILKFNWCNLNLITLDRVEKS